MMYSFICIAEDDEEQIDKTDEPKVEGNGGEKERNVEDHESDRTKYLKQKGTRIVKIGKIREVISENKLRIMW